MCTRLRKGMESYDESKVTFEKSRITTLPLEAAIAKKKCLGNHFRSFSGLGVPNILSFQPDLESKDHRTERVAAVIDPIRGIYCAMELGEVRGRG